MNWCQMLYLLRKDLGTFIRMYEFLPQIVPYDDLDLERRCVYGRSLMPRLAGLGMEEPLNLSEDVKLTHYGLEMLESLKLNLDEGDGVKLSAVSDACSKASKDAESRHLSEIVEKMNDFLSGELSEADKIAYPTHIHGKLMESAKLAEQASGNGLEQFALGDFEK